jgi:hypothetical protein
MDADEVEDMLFGRDGSPDFFEGALNGESEDSPMLTPATTDHEFELESHTDLNTTGPRSPKSPAGCVLPPVRDRYFSELTVY